MTEDLSKSKKLSVLLSLIWRNPSYGLDRILAELSEVKGKKIYSRSGIQKALTKLGLNTAKKRRAWARRITTAEVAGKFAETYAKGIPRRLKPEERLEMIRLAEEREIPISRIAQANGISRKSFYKWKRRYEASAPGKEYQEVCDKKPFIERRWNQLTDEQVARILEIVVEQPEYSTHKVAQILVDVGNHGAQNVFKRMDLNTYEKRLAYAQAQAPIITPVVGLPETVKRFIGKIPVISAIPPPTREKIAPLARPFVFSFLSSVVFSTIFIFWLKMITQAPTLGAKLGLFFASVSLVVGGFFFAYSMKYYLTLAIVLSFSRQPLDEGGGYAVGLNGRIGGNGGNGGNGGWLQRIFGLNGGIGRNGRNGRNGPNKMVTAGGLQPSLEHIKLKRYPFVSIHLPFYNEKKVAERILSACTSMDYPNYEIVVCDDSTDETTKIVQRFAEQHNKEQTTNNKGPVIKVLHRPTRQGFKGGALAYALKHMNPKTEFIVVFDADFIPYPDTLELFVKYFKANNPSASSGQVHSENYKKSNIAVVGGYQWHVLNKSENWITRGVRTEYSGSYVIERPGREILGLLRQISGSVYMIRADLLKKFGWGTSITEDFQLTLKLYEQGYKVIYTPYVQAPAECVSTLKRLIRQRMRWAEGHSNNIRRMFMRLMSSPKLTLSEKLEVLYLSPYYLQAFFFLLGTFCWLMAETVFRARLPFWTSLWGWSLVLTNFFSLPLVNAVGLFLEESEEKDYLGLLSFIFLSYILVPFQAYASVKGFLEKQEGPWFRTPKTGKITDIFTRGRFYRWISGILPGRLAPVARMSADRSRFRANPYLALATANNRFENFRISPRKIKWIGRTFLVSLLIFSTLLLSLAPTAPYFIKPKETQAKGFGMLAGPSSAGLPQASLAKASREESRFTLEILNPYSHPKEGEDWVVNFKTKGKADLTITPQDQTTVDDLDFVRLKCGDEEREPKIFDGLASADKDIIFYPDWECLEIGSVTHHVNKSGKHTLKFQFRDQIAYAYNAAWLSGYSYRKEIPITGQTGAGTNYQVNLEVHSGSGSDSNGVVYLGNTSEFRLSVSSSNHDNYGLSYPVTYIFNIPSGLTSGRAYYRYINSGSWTQLTEKTSNDFFDGIDAVRFDYVNDKAYVSIAFSSTSDDIYLKFTDSDDNPIDCAYSSVATYYDNRKAVVVLTADDWSGYSVHEEAFQDASNACQARNIWITVGLIINHVETYPPPTWSLVQAELDEGYVEAASHSYIHPHIPYSNYVQEIDTSKSVILANLTLPNLYKKATAEYVYAWIEPYGESDASQRSQSGASKYLTDRDVTTDHTFTTWDATNGLYNRIGYSIWMGSDGGTTDVATLNASFDARYAAGEIYHLFCHPHNVDWTPGQYATQHLDYIKGKKDVWYVGFGALYLYHYVQERDIVTIASYNPQLKSDFSDIRFTDDDGTTELDHWMEPGSGLSRTFWIEIKDDLGSNQNFYIYYGNPDAASASDGNATFLLFDDFPGTTLNTDKWNNNTSASDSLAVNDGLTITINDTGASRNIAALDSKGTYSHPLAVESKWKVNFNGPTGGASSTCIRFNIALHKTANTEYALDTNYLFGCYAWRDASPNDWINAVGTEVGNTADNDNIDNVDIRESLILKSGASKEYRNSVLELSNANTTAMVAPNYFGLQYKMDPAVAIGTQYIYVTFVALRKYVSPEPSVGTAEPEEHSTDTSTSSSATAYSFQRKTWYDGTRLWSAFYSGTEIEFWYSADWGSTWTQNTSATITVSTNDFTIEADTADAFIAYTNGYDIIANEDTGTYPATNFAWGASPTTVYDGSSDTDKYSYPAMAKDSNNKVWITARHYETGTVDKQVALGADDGYVSGGEIFKTGTVLYAGEWDSGAMHAFARWTGVTIEGTIDVSYIQCYGSEVTGTPQLKVYGVDEDNPPAPTTYAEFVADPLTTAGIDWDGAWTVGAWNQSLSLNTIFQELVDTHTISNEAVMVQIKSEGGYGSGYNGGNTYEQTPVGTLSPKLHIEYSDHKFQARQASSANDISAWGTATTLDTSANSNKYGTIVPSGTGEVYAVWIDDTTIEGKEYTSGAWAGSPTTIATGGTGLSNNMSAVSDSSGYVHLLYINSSDYAVYQEYTTSWQTAVTLDSTAGNDYPTISLNTSNSDLYALWIRSNVIYYKKGVSPYASANWDSSATSWQATGTNAWVTSNYSGNGMIFAQWTGGTGSPYSVNWDYVIIPENLWLFLILSPFAGKLMEKLKRRKPK